MKRTLLGLICLVLLPACARAPLASDSMRVGPPQLPRTGLGAVGPVRLGADSVELLTDGAAVAGRLVAAVSEARRTVHAEIYEFNRPDLLAAMVAACRRGLEVQVILDPTVGVDTATRSALLAAGAEVTLFPDQKRQIDHVKLLVLDGVAGFFGGMNWGARSYRNHDFELAVRGPSAATLDRIFAADRIRTGATAGDLRGPGAGTPSAPAEPPDERGEWGSDYGRAATGLDSTHSPDNALRLLTTYPGDTIRPAAESLIGAARHYLFLTMFVMTDRHVIGALADAARRGVAVWCLLDPTQEPNRQTALTLRLAGIQVAFYRSLHGELLHAKAAVADGERVLLGSANWSRSGFTRNHELDAELDSPVLAAVAMARMEADWHAST